MSELHDWMKGSSHEQGKTAAPRRARVLVRGQVQGVGYRHYTMRMAQKLPLQGYVRNLPGGDVEVLMEGPENAIREMLGHLRRGPAYSDVRDLEVSWQPARGDMNNFAIKF